MDNKQIFAIAGLVTRALINSKVVDGKARDIKQTVFEAMQPTLEAIDIPKQDSDEEFTLAKRLATDPVYAKGWVIQSLAKSMDTDSGNTQAAKELREMLNIGNKSDDLVIHTIDYSNTIIDCPHCNTNILQPIDQ